MEVKIGVQQAARELVLESAQTTEEVSEIVNAALAAGEHAVLALDDEHGKRVMVPVDKLAYVEIGEPTVRRVGFGAI